MTDDERKFLKVWPWIVAAIFAAYWCSALHWLSLPALRNDFVGFVWLADHLDVTQPRTLATPFYPFGYPALLLLGETLGIGFLATAKSLQLLSALTLIWLVWALSRALDLGSLVATGACVFLGVSSPFATEALGEQGHLLATALGSGGLLWSIRLMQHRDLPRGQLLGVGAVVGAAYLIQYHALLYLLVVLGMVLVLGRVARGRLRRASSLGWIVIGWTVVAAPQLILSTLAHGNPFFSKQSVRVGWGALGMDFSRFTELYELYSYGYLLQNHAWEVTSNFIGNVSGYLTNGLTAWLVPASVVAVWMITRADQDIRRIATLAVLITHGLIYLVAVSTAFYLPRISLPALPIAAIVSSAALVSMGRAIADRMSDGRVSSLLPAGVLAMGLIAFGWTSSRSTAEQLQWYQHLGTQSEMLTELLTQKGIDDPREVLTTDPHFVYLHDKPSELLYVVGGHGWIQIEPEMQKNRPPIRPQTIDQLLQVMRQREFKAIVVGDQRALGPELVEALSSGNVPHSDRLWRVNRNWIVYAPFS